MGKHMPYISQAIAVQLMLLCASISYNVDCR